jgi:hypothetical protein
VVADVTAGLMDSSGLFSFALQISMLDMPGLREHYTSMKMAIFKSSDDFAKLYDDLSELVILHDLPTVSGGSDENSPVAVAGSSSVIITSKQLYSFKDWLSGVLRQQSTQCGLYRQVLKTFLLATHR